MPFSATDPIHTPRRFKGGDPTVRDLARKALAEAILFLEEQGIDWMKPWGDIQYVDVAGRHVPVPGGAGGDVYNIVFSVPSAPSEGRLLLRSRRIFIPFFSFVAACPFVHALFPYSQSPSPPLCNIFFFLLF